MTQKTRMLVTLAAAVVVAAGAGAYAFYGVHEVEQAEAAKKEADEKLLGLAQDAITRLQVKARGGETVLEKQGGTWRIVKPVDAPAEAGTVESLLVQLEGARRSRAIDSVDLGRFGLAAPAVAVTATAGDGKEATVALGARNDFDGTLFVRDAAGRVGTTSAALRSALEKSTFDLRDKRLIVVGEDAVQEIVVRGANRFSLAKNEDGWRIVEPLQDKADDPTVTGIVRALQDARALAFAAEAGAVDPAKFGLVEPAVEVTLRRSAGEPIVLAFGKADGKVYARSGDGPVLEVTGTVLGQVDETAEELRDKRLFHFASGDVRRVKFSGEGGEMELEKRGEDWRLVAPKDAKAKKWKVDSIVSMVRELRAKRFVEGAAAEYGLAAPVRTVTVLGEGGKELATLLVGKTASALAYVQAAGSPRIAEIDSPRLSTLPKALADVEEPAPEEQASGSSAE